MKLNWNFQGGEGVQNRLPSVAAPGGVWIFSATTQFPDNCSEIVGSTTGVEGSKVWVPFACVARGLTSVKKQQIINLKQENCWLPAHFDQARRL